MHPEESAPESRTRNGLAPVIGHAPRLLILGSFPSKRSLVHRQYYAHPQNQFWQIMESLLGVDRHLPYPHRIRELVRYHIALWDVIAACHREGSADDRIKDPVFNPLLNLLDSHPTIRTIAFNGATAARYGARLQVIESIRLIPLPSTSPANARFTLAEKTRRWEIIGEFL